MVSLVVKKLNERIQSVTGCIDCLHGIFSGKKLNERIHCKLQVILSAYMVSLAVKN